MSNNTEALKRDVQATVYKLTGAFEPGHVSEKQRQALSDVVDTFESLIAALEQAQQQVVPDEMLCDFYEVSNWPDLVRELVKHVEHLQDSAKRNVKPWEDTFPETLLPAHIERVKRADDAVRAAIATAPKPVDMY